MAKQWEGKSRGTVLGYRIFNFFMRRFGIRAAYFILYFVALYYCFFARDNTRASYYYFRKRRGFSRWKSSVGVYKGYYKFGQTIIDKVAISSGLKSKFTYNFDGIEHIKDLLDQQKGGILISAHVGNFEIADFFLDEIDSRSHINLVTTNAEHENIQSYLESVTSKSNIGTILIKEDLSHIFEIHSAFDRGELVCFTGDRYFEGSKALSEELLGEKALFPAGPFLLASRLKVPVLFVYVMKETTKHYHLFARKAEVKSRDGKGLLKTYTESVEWILEKYPYQWFNYFDFWKSTSK